MLLLKFGELENIIQNKNIEFIRNYKYELIPLSWEYFSTSPIFSIEELREFKDYINWTCFFTTDELIRIYGTKKLKEFEFFLEGDLREMYEDEIKQIVITEEIIDENCIGQI